MAKDQRAQAQLLVSGELLAEIEVAVQMKLFAQFCNEEGSAEIIRAKMNALSCVIGEIRSLAARAIDNKDTLTNGHGTN